MYKNIYKVCNVTATTRTTGTCRTPVAPYSTAVDTCDNTRSRTHPHTHTHTRSHKLKKHTHIHKLNLT